MYSLDDVYGTSNPTSGNKIFIADRVVRSLYYKLVISILSKMCNGSFIQESVENV